MFSTIRCIRHTMIAGVALFMLGGNLSHAGALPKPEGRVVLTVSGNIANTNDGDVAKLDLKMIQTLPGRTIRTSTPWTEGIAEFEGVDAAALVEYVGMSGNTAKVTALNDYSVTMDVSDLRDEGAILAYRLNGKILSIREKGPLWIIFPFDSDKRYSTDAFWSKAVWQIRDIVVD
jgi:hypothetical protein